MNNPYPKNTFKMFGVGKSLGRVHKSKGSEVQTRPFPDPGDIDFEDLLIQLLSLCGHDTFFSTLGILQNQRLYPLVDLEVHCPA